MKTVTGDPHELLDAFERRYRSQSTLDEVCSVEKYDEEITSHRDRRYSQIGVRTNFPVEVVERWEPGFVAREVVDGFERSEIGYVASQVTESHSCERVDAGNPNDLLEVAAEENLSHLLVPMDHGLLKQLRDRDVVSTRKSDGASVVEAGLGGSLELHLSDGQEVVAVADDTVNLVQKHGEDASPPAFVHFDEANLNYAREFMVYFGSEVREVNGERFFDLMYRVVLSEPEVVGVAVEFEF